MANVKFYICEHCGNVAVKITDKGVPLVCCGQKMTLLEAGTVDASREKHVPVIVREGDRLTVKVGAVEHPMTEQHYIDWICVVTEDGALVKKLDPTGNPEAQFCVAADAPATVYAYCNLHGLWAAEC